MGIPVIEHIFRNCSSLGIPVWVLTSEERSDDSLTEFLVERNISVYRGSLENVLERFIKFGTEYNFDYLIRISGDSPLIHPEVIQEILETVSSHWNADIITNVHPRTYPKGQSVELIPLSTLLKLGTLPLLAENREHVTSYIYNNSDVFNIVNLRNSIDLSHINLCVDEPSDLNALEKIMQSMDVPTSPVDLSWEDFSSRIMKGYSQE